MNGEFLQGIAAKSRSMVAAAAFAAIVWTSPLLAQDAGGDASAESAASGSTTAEPSSEASADDGQADSASTSDEEQAPEDVELRDRSEIAPGTRLHASVDVMANWVDNFFYSATDQESVVGWFINPNVTYGSASPRFRSNTSVGANIAFFSVGGSDDDYRDLFAQTGATWKVAPAHRLGYDIALRSGHDPFGLIRTENNGEVSRTLDRWVDEKYTLEYRLGQPRSSFSVENKASVYQKVYHTNRNLPGGGFGTRFLDNDIETFETTGLYHYSPKTHFQLNLVTSHVNFARDFPGIPSRDAQEYRARAGIRWIATAKTTGDFRIGYFTRHFESNQLHNHTKLDWVVGVDWSPVKRTSLQLQTGRQSVESYNVASFIDVSYVRLSWKQEWFPRLTTQVTTGYSYADFVGLARHDETLFLNLRADYRLLPKVSVYAGYDLDDRTSNNGAFEYDRSVLYVGLRAFY